MRWLCHAWMFASLVCLPMWPAFGASTQPTTLPSKSITLELHDVAPKLLIDELRKQTAGPIAVLPVDLLENPGLPRVTLNLKNVPFWEAMEQVSRQAGLEPVVTPEEPYPRFQLGLGNGAFWEEPHVVTGPVVLFANELARTITVNLGKKQNHTERELQLNLTAYLEPGLQVLSASPEVKLVEALDERGRSMLPTALGDSLQANAEAGDMGTISAGFTWGLEVALSAMHDSQQIAKLKGVASIRLQTGGERVEFDDVLRARNVNRLVLGTPVTFKNLKKADVEYVLQMSLRRDRTPEAAWLDLHHSVYNGMMALYDSKGRLVAARGTENGGDYANNKIDATLRFVREPGVTDPAAGEPYKLVWLAPTQCRDLALPFEFHDLPVPQ